MVTEQAYKQDILFRQTAALPPIGGAVVSAY
jgi:hypothetical protein